MLKLRQDYLAKPVKGKLLEKVGSPKATTSGRANKRPKMLVKWALEGRRKAARETPRSSDKDRRSNREPKGGKGFSASDHPQTAGMSLESETTAQALTAELDRLHYQSDAAFARSSENEGERAMRRIYAEERDRKLRDEKLFSLVGPQLLHHDAAEGPQNEPLMPLTEENIEKLVHEQDADGAATRKSASPGLVGGSGGGGIKSNATNHAAASTSDHLGVPRPDLQHVRQRESEQTIVERVAR